MLLATFRTMGRRPCCRQTRPDCPLRFRGPLRTWINSEGSRHLRYVDALESACRKPLPVNRREFRGHKYSPLRQFAQLPGLLAVSCRIQELLELSGKQGGVMGVGIPLASSEHQGSVPALSLHRHHVDVRQSPAPDSEPGPGYIGEPGKPACSKPLQGLPFQRLHPRHDPFRIRQCPTVPRHQAAACAARKYGTGCCFPTRASGCPFPGTHHPVRQVQGAAPRCSMIPAASVPPVGAIPGENPELRHLWAFVVPATEAPRDAVRPVR